MGDRVIGGSDPAAQAHFVIDKIEGALQSLGATLADVIRTRVYVRNIDDWEPVARAHGARFARFSRPTRWSAPRSSATSIWWRSKRKPRSETRPPRIS